MLDELMGQSSENYKDEFTCYLSGPQINHNENDGKHVKLFIIQYQF